MKKSFYLLGAYLIVLTLSSCKSGKSTEVIDKGKNVDKVEIVAKYIPGFSGSHIQDESGSWTYTFTSDMSKDEFLKEMFFNHIADVNRYGSDSFFGYSKIVNYSENNEEICTKYHGSYFNEENHIGNNILNFEIDSKNKKIDIKSKDDYNYTKEDNYNFNSALYSNGSDVWSSLEYGNVKRKSSGTYPSTIESGEVGSCDYSFDYSCYQKEYGMFYDIDSMVLWRKYSNNPENYKDYLNLESGYEFYGKNIDNSNCLSSNFDEYTYADGYFHPGSFSLAYSNDRINPTNIESNLDADKPYYIKKDDEDGSYLELCGSRPMCMDIGLFNDIHAGITSEKLDCFSSQVQFVQPITYQSKIAYISERHFNSRPHVSDDVKSIYDIAYENMDLNYELTDKYIIIDIKNYFYQYLYDSVLYYEEVDPDYFIRNPEFAESIKNQIKDAKEKDNLYEHIKYYINCTSIYSKLVEYDDISYEMTYSPFIDYVLYEDKLKRDVSGTYDDNYISSYYEYYQNNGYDFSTLREHYYEEYTDCTYSNCRIEIVSDSIDADFYNSKADSIKREVKEGCKGYING
ncbi:MAG: hypothetical protein K5892_01125 [Acholeplasmatales bacterium]|nr:hypothetical protein [Acholeplasmatales bacterium]